VEWFEGFGEQKDILEFVLDAIRGGPRSK